jgi:hypothetical protein
MPREIYVLTSGPVTFEAVVRAAAEVDETLGLRRLDLAGESALQLVGDDGRAVLTCWTSRRLAEGSDVQRVTRGFDLPDGTVWWTEAQAPWGRAGDAGVAVAIGVAALLGGRVKVEDGT